MYGIMKEKEREKMEEVGGAYLVFGFFGSCMNKEKEVDKKNKRVAERERKGFHLGLERERREKREEREERGREEGSSDHKTHLLGSIFL